MNIGQISYPKLTSAADYLQLDICGLSKDEALKRYLAYNTSKPVILHGDWTKKGFSENSLLDGKRRLEYSEIIKSLQEVCPILGFTVHPPKRSKSDFSAFLEAVDDLENLCGLQVFLENRSSKTLLISTPEEIISLSKQHFMTIDIPQLYISCNYDQSEMEEVLKLLHKPNIKEIHLANIARDGNRTFVGRKLEDGVLDIPRILSYLSEDMCFTLEILGGVPTFESQQSILRNWFK